MQGSLVRFYLGEQQRHHGVLLWEWLLEKANAAGIPGGCAFRAIGGFGRHRAVHEVKRFEGPERIAGEWWRVTVDRLPDPAPTHARRKAGRNDPAEDDAPLPPLPHAGRPLLTRDYFRVEDARGRRFWLFRHGLYERETTSPAWYIHGLFA